MSYKRNPYTGKLDYFEGTPQDLGTTNSPTFSTVKLSGLTDGYIPYHVNDATGLADGPTKANVDSAVSLKHAINSGGDFLTMQVFS